MEFKVEFLDYGRFGVVASEPRTGIQVSGDTHEEARERMVERLRAFDGYLSPQDGPDLTVETLRI